jgi:hypothetical protein
MTSTLCVGTCADATSPIGDSSLAAETVFIGSVLPEIWGAIDTVKLAGISKDSLITVLQNILRDVQHFRVRNPGQRLDIMSARGDARLFAEVMTQHFPIPRNKRFWPEFVSSHPVIYKKVLEHVAATVKRQSSVPTASSLKRKLSRAPATLATASGSGARTISSASVRESVVNHQVPVRAAMLAHGHSPAPGYDSDPDNERRGHVRAPVHSDATRSCSKPVGEGRSGEVEAGHPLSENYTTPVSRHQVVPKSAGSKSGLSSRQLRLSEMHGSVTDSRPTTSPSVTSSETRSFSGDVCVSLSGPAWRSSQGDSNLSAPSPAIRDALDNSTGGLSEESTELTILPKIPLTPSEVLQEQTYLMSYNLERLGASQLFGFFNSDDELLPESYTPPFDRNDLFVTNVQDAHGLFRLAENVCQNSITRVKNGLTAVDLTTFPSMYVVLIRFNGDPQQKSVGSSAAVTKRGVDLSRQSLYITWCVKQDYASFLDNVLRGIIPCNQHLTNVIEACSRLLGGNYSQWKRMFSVELIDDSGGTVTEKSLPVFLASLNGYIDQYNEPVAVNINLLRNIPNGRHRLIFESGSLQAYRFNWMYVKAYSSFIVKIKEINAAQSTCQDIVRTFFSKYYTHLEHYVVFKPATGTLDAASGVSPLTADAPVDVVTEGTLEDADAEQHTCETDSAVEAAVPVVTNSCLIHETSDARAAHEINGLWNLFQQYFASVHDHLVKIGVEFQLLKTVAGQRREYVQQAFAAAQVMQFRSDVPIPNTLLNLYEESIEDVEFKTTSVMYSELSEAFKLLIEMKECMLSCWLRPSTKITNPVEMFALLRSLCTLNLWQPRKLSGVRPVVAISGNNDNNVGASRDTGTAIQRSEERHEQGSVSVPLTSAKQRGMACTVPLVAPSISAVVVGETSRVRASASTLCVEVVSLPTPPHRLSREVLNKAHRLSQKRVHPDKHLDHEKERATEQSRVVSDAKSFVALFF